MLERAQKLSSDATRRVELSRYARSNLVDSFGVRLDSVACTQDIIALDVFSEITFAQDIPMKQLLRGIDQRRAAVPGLDRNTLHFLLHRPQRSELLMFHELAVGHLVNLTINAGRVPARGALAIDDYWGSAAFFFERLADLLSMSPAHLVQFHFESPSAIRRRFPRRIQDLLLVCSHLAWYVELLTRMLLPQNTSAALTALFVCYLQPCLDRLEAHPRAHLRADASRIIDSLIFEEVIPRHRGARSFSQSDLAVVLARLSDRTWE